MLISTSTGASTLSLMATAFVCVCVCVGVCICECVSVCECVGVRASSRRVADTFVSDGFCFCVSHRRLQERKEMEEKKTSKIKLGQEPSSSTGSQRANVFWTD